MAPAALEATQVYSPACLAATASIASCLIRLLLSEIIISVLPGEIGSPSKFHVSSNGKSPLLIAQAIVTSSSAFTGPSPKEKGAICGATVVDNRKDKEK